MNPLFKKACRVTALVSSIITFSTAVLALDITGAGATFPYPAYAKWADSERTLQRCYFLSWCRRIID